MRLSQLGKLSQILLKMGLKMLTGAHKMQRMALAFVDFFRVTPQRWQ
jgi:hypothetical protein